MGLRLVRAGEVMRAGAHVRPEKAQLEAGQEQGGMSSAAQSPSLGPIALACGHSYAGVLHAALLAAERHCRARG
ncbi:hypothetical protein [Acidocella sp.]|uniref:hypothetical protein n=1 Tax=Acidocella sp. TaxID=50710 RepID=UPI002630EE2D|nr:hypothetical protein [Acidocella sp.]